MPIEIYFCAVVTATVGFLVGWWVVDKYTDPGRNRHGEKKRVKICPKCKSKATKIVNLSTGKILCQTCGYEW